MENDRPPPLWSLDPAEPSSTRENYAGLLALLGSDVSNVGLMTLVKKPVHGDRPWTRDEANAIALEARKKNLGSCNIRWEPGVPTTANPGPMVLLLSDGKGAGSIDRAIIKIE